MITQGQCQYLAVSLHDGLVHDKATFFNRTRGMFELVWISIIKPHMLVIKSLKSICKFLLHYSFLAQRSWYRFISYVNFQIVVYKLQWGNKHNLDFRGSEK